MITSLIVLIVISIVINITQLIYKLADSSVIEKEKYLFKKEQELDIRSSEYYSLERRLERRRTLEIEVATMEARKDNLVREYEIKEEQWRSRTLEKDNEVQRQKSIIDDLIRNQPKQIIGIPVPEYNNRR